MSLQIAFPRLNMHGNRQLRFEDAVCLNTQDAGLIQILYSVQYFTKPSALDPGLLESVQQRKCLHTTTYLVLNRLTPSGDH